MTVYVRNVNGNDGDTPDDPRNLGGAGWTLLQLSQSEVSSSSHVSRVEQWNSK
jgi:hypothetical protein